MADYPAFTQVRGSRGVYREPLEIDFCLNGQVNGRDFFDGDSRVFDVIHVGLSQANLTTILDLYKDKGKDTFTFDSTETGATENVKFEGRPQVTAMGANKYNVRCRLVEVT